MFPRRLKRIIPKDNPPMNEKLRLTKEKLKELRLPEEEIGQIEWDSPIFDMSFVDDYPKEVKALLDAQTHHLIEVKKFRSPEEVKEIEKRIREALWARLDEADQLAPDDKDFKRRIKNLMAFLSPEALSDRKEGEG